VTSPPALGRLLSDWPFAEGTPCQSRRNALDSERRSVTLMTLKQTVQGTFSHWWDIMGQQYKVDQWWGNIIAIDFNTKVWLSILIWAAAVSTWNWQTQCTSKKIHCNAIADCRTRPTRYLGDTSVLCHDMWGHTKRHIFSLFEKQTRPVVHKRLSAHERLSPEPNPLPWVPAISRISMMKARWSHNKSNKTHIMRNNNWETRTNIRENLRYLSKCSQKKMSEKLIQHGFIVTWSTMLLLHRRIAMRDVLLEWRVILQCYQQSVHLVNWLPSKIYLNHQWIISDGIFLVNQRNSGIQIENRRESTELRSGPTLRSFLSM
jgi:hypothetical protein